MKICSASGYAAFLPYKSAWLTRHRCMFILVETGISSSQCRLPLGSKDWTGHPQSLELMGCFASWAHLHEVVAGIPRRSYSGL